MAPGGHVAGGRSNPADFCGNDLDVDDPVTDAQMVAIDTAGGRHVKVMEHGIGTRQVLVHFRWLWHVENGSVGSSAAVHDWAVGLGSRDRPDAEATRPKRYVHLLDAFEPLT